MLSGYRPSLAQLPVCLFLVLAFPWAVRAAVSASRPTAPSYSNEERLADALRVVDLVVEGTPAGGRAPETCVLEVQRVLWASPGLPSAATSPGSLRLFCLNAPAVRAGVWLLAETPSGFFVLNPGGEPLTSQRWSTLAARTPSGRAGLVRKMPVPYQLDRFRSVAGKEVQEGVSVYVSSEVHLSLYEQGTLVGMWIWDDHGRISILLHSPVVGPGQRWVFNGGRVRAVESLRNGKSDGPDRRYDEETGTLLEEVSWQKGLRDGPSRSWDRSGKLISEVVYDQGLIAPVTHGKGPPHAELHRSAESEMYSASRDRVAAIKIGMTVQEVADLLGVDVSERSGLRFRADCENNLHVAFAAGRVASIRRLPNGAFCQ